MRLISTSLAEVVVIEPRVFIDERGFFLENFNRKSLASALGGTVDFVQDNHSRSTKHVLRGLHYQIQHPQGKLVRVARGCVFDVAVDIRKSSSNFGKWVGVELSEKNHRQMWIPPGFAHGFLALSSVVDFFYKTTDYWHPEHERCIRWNDGQIGIDWPSVRGGPVLSSKDREGSTLAEAEVFD